MGTANLLRIVVRYFFNLIKNFLAFVCFFRLLFLQEDLKYLVDIVTYIAMGKSDFLLIFETQNLLAIVVKVA